MQRVRGRVGGNRGGSIGPYASGKLYCAFCGEYRYYGIDAVTIPSGMLVCIECGIRVRKQGRHWSQTKEPKRY